MINIGILTTGLEWGGGLDLLRIIINGLQNSDAYLNNEISIKIMVGGYEKKYISVPKKIIKKIIRKKSFSFLSKEQITNFFNNCDKKLEFIYYSGRVDEIEKVAKKNNIDILLPCNLLLGKKNIIKKIGYIYDFQHKYFPEYFNLEICINRDTEFSKRLDEFESIIVNSLDTKKDIERFYPKAKAKIFAMPFTAAPLEKWFEFDTDKLVVEYKLPEKYFIMSNQFMIHKDQITAFKAFAKLISEKKYENYKLICTGLMKDIRFPEYINMLSKYIKDNGLEEKIIFTGHIPKEDQIAIIIKSTALIQTTLFEGGPGGGSVYDAVSVGVPVIISDIAINKEVEGDNVLFFEAKNSEDLFEKMKKILEMPIKRKEKQELIRIGIEKKRKLGNIIVEIITKELNEI